MPGGGLFSTASAVVQTDGTWSTTIATSRIGEGETYVHAVVTDDFGNTTTVDQNFIIDLTPPTDLAITSVAGDDIINAAELKHATIAGTVEVADPLGDGTDAGKLTISIDGGGSTTFVTQPSGSLGDADFSQIFDASGVTDGEHTITLTATDPAGNTATVTKQVLVDTTPPKIADHLGVGRRRRQPHRGQVRAGRARHLGCDRPDGHVLVDGVEAGQAVVQADGTWLTTVSFAAAATGGHDVTAKVVGRSRQSSAGPMPASMSTAGSRRTQLSVGPNGQQGGGQGVMFPELDGAGDKLVFTGLNFNLMSTATGAYGAQVYIKDLTTGAITFAKPDPSGNAQFAGISQDGRYIEFVSDDQLDPTDGPFDVYNRPSLFLHLYGRSHDRRSVSSLFRPGLAGHARSRDHLLSNMRITRSGFPSRRCRFSRWRLRTMASIHGRVQARRPR